MKCLLYDTIFYRNLNPIPQKGGRGNGQLVQDLTSSKNLEIESMFSKHSLLFLCCSSLFCHRVAYALAVESFFAWLCLQPVDLRKLYQSRQLSAW